MPPIQPRPPRWRSEATPAGLRITIPAKRIWPALVGLILWLVAWGSGSNRLLE